MKDDDKPDFVDIIRGAIDVYEENKHLLDGIDSDSNKLDVSEREPLQQVVKSEESVIVTMEVSSSDLDQITLNLEGEKAVIGIGSSTLEVSVPEDAEVGSADATLNNGILEVTIPRNGGEE